MHCARALADVFERVPNDSRSWWERLLGIATPRSLLAMIEAMNFDAMIVSGTRAVNFLNQDCDDGPQILLVGVGPFGLIPHWIIIFRRHINLYAVYDSWPYHDVEANLDLGNRFISRSELARIWNKGKFGGLHNLRISIASGPH